MATLPLGYADGVPRRLSSTGGAVLIGGRRRPIVGVVTTEGNDPATLVNTGLTAGSAAAAGRLVRPTRAG